MVNSQCVCVCVCVCVGESVCVTRSQLSSDTGKVSKYLSHLFRVDLEIKTREKTDGAFQSGHVEREKRNALNEVKS